jgi:hypothetical protein
VKPTKAHILEEIKRTAADNGNVPLGIDRFFRETGIKVADWNGKYWSRWGDAVREAGFTPNQFVDAYPSELLLTRLADLCRELGRFPVVPEMRIKRRSDLAFPNDKVFFNRFGAREKVIAALATFCEQRPEYADVAAMCAQASQNDSSDLDATDAQPADDVVSDLGFVYLLRSGKFYKIGRTNAVGRRERELAIQLPEKCSVVHSIKTDDPAGIEDYWHRRFESRRMNGEWFQLSAEDVAAFRRRKFM